MYCNSCVPFYKGENISVSLKLIKCCLKKMFYFIMLDMFYIFYYVRYVYILGLRIRLNTTVYVHSYQPVRSNYENFKL